MVNWADGGTQGGAALATVVAARDCAAPSRAPLGTRLRNDARQGIGGIFNSTTAHYLQKTYKCSGWAPVYALRRRPIRKRIMGRGMCSVAPGLGSGRHLRS